MKNKAIYPGTFHPINYGHIEFKDAESAETQEVKDDLYMQIQKHIMDQAIFLAIHDQVQTVAYNPDLEGVRFANGNWQMRMYDVRKK